MKYGYIYIIYFTDHRSNLYNHFYIGQRKLRKNESLFDPSGKHYYHGSSSIAWKEYWPYYTLHKKEILCWCESKEELFEKEHEYIKENIDNPLCINKNTGGTPICLGWNKGKKTPDEVRKKQSDAKIKYYKTHDSPLKGKTASEEARHSVQIGTQRFYDNGGHPWNYHKKLSKEFCDNNRRAQKKYWAEHKIPNKEKICINNGIKNTYIKEEELEYYLKLGYKRGMKPRNNKD